MPKLGSARATFINYSKSVSTPILKKISESIQPPGHLLREAAPKSMAGVSSPWSLTSPAHTPYRSKNAKMPKEGEEKTLNQILSCARDAGFEKVYFVKDNNLSYVGDILELPEISFAALHVLYAYSKNLGINFSKMLDSTLAHLPEISKGKIPQKDSEQILFCMGVLCHGMDFLLSISTLDSINDKAKSESAEKYSLELKSKIHLELSKK